MIVVSDASPLIALDAIGHLDLLVRLYERLVIPPEIFQEVGTMLIQQADWLSVIPTSNLQKVEEIQLTGLDRGEAAAIALALDLNASLLLIDERKGRQVAHNLGLQVVGTLGILIEAKFSGHIEHVKSILDLMIESVGFRISEDLYRTVLEQCNEL